MDRIKELSLDQKAKLYYMGLVRKGEIDRLPEDPKAAFVKDMMGRKDELTERFQQLAGIKPLYEQDDEDLRLEPEDGEYVDEIELEDLDFETLKASFPKFYQKVKFTRPQTGEPYYEDAISFPNLDDSSMVIGDKLALEDWKDKVLRRFGNVTMEFNDEAKNSWDRVFVHSDDFNDARDGFIRGKMSAMQKDQELGRSID